MPFNRWLDCTAIFDEAVELPFEARAALLEERCGGDAALRRKVELLLEADEKAGDFIASSALEVAPDLLLDDADALIGQHLGHYRIESVLGIGGMGVVYLAQDERLGRKVGLKLLPASLVADPTQLGRLKQEARTASALNHPHIVTIHEIGEAGGLHYIATEFIEGLTLRERIARATISPDETLEIGVQIASALSVAHAAGIVHCDIKPENIMLRPDGIVKVLDFGIAKFTQQENSFAGVEGTRHYMSPEQARGEELDARSDIWSLGVTLREMTGASAPAEIEQLITRALSEERNARYASATELRAALQRVQRKLEAGSRLDWRIAAALLIVAAVGVFLYTKGPAPRPAPSPPDKSIAVLPFADLSAAHDQEYFCDGIQEEILTRLSKIADLKVISRTSTQRYKSAPENLLEIARQLGVAHIVEGSVQKMGDQVRVNVQLINARTDSHIWADKFDRNLTDIFTVESEIATHIATVLRARLSGTEQRVISSRPTENSEAHQAYLKGLYYWSKFTPADFEKSRSYFQQAIDLDSSYAIAHAGLASYYARAAANGLTPPNETWPKCEAEVNKALELDETLAEAYNPRASLRLYGQRDWPAAERDLRRGAELNPNSAEIRVHYALCLAVFGRYPEALREIERAVELEPASLRSNTTWARILFAAGQEDAAIAQCRNTIELAPGYPRTHEWLGYFYEKKKMPREAIAELAKALASSGETEEAAMLERNYAASDYEAAIRALAQKRLEQLNDKSTRGEYVPAAEYLLACMRLGDKERAFAWLAKAVEERNWLIYELRLDPRFDAMREDGRFEELLNKVVPRPAAK